VHYTWILSYVDTIADNNFMYQHKGYGKYNTKVILRTKNCYVSSETFIDTVAPLPLVDFILHPDTPNNAQVQCLNGNRFHWRNVTINPPIIGLSTDQAIIYWEFGDGNSSYIYNGRNCYSEAGLYEVKLKVSTTKTNNLSVYCADSAMDYVQVFDKIIEDSLIVEYPFIKLGDTLRIAYLDTGFQYWSTSLGTFYNADTMLFLPSLGTYMISLKANAHCDTYSFPITVVDSTPSLFILDEYTLIKGNNDSVQVHLPIAESYLWSTGSTSQNLVFKASNYSLGEHVIWVDVIFNPNFSYRDSFTLKIIDSSASISYLNSLKSNIYPNPGNGKFHLSTGQPVTYKVFTSQGELILQTGTQVREHTLQLESYPAGVYLIVHSNGQQTSDRRWVIL
jgi:hypothetical protein